MSLATNLQDLATRVATECKGIRTLINGNAADLSALTTTAKSNLVAAVNELNAEIDALSSGAAGIDDGTTATTSTWSSSKTADAILAAKDAILGGAGGAYDTLQELKDLLDSSDAADDSAIATITTALGNRVRTDTAAQGLDSTQQANARTNIDVYSKTETGDVTTNFVTTFEAGLA